MAQCPGLCQAHAHSGVDLGPGVEVAQPAGASTGGVEAGGSPLRT